MNGKEKGNKIIFQTVMIHFDILVKFTLKQTRFSLITINKSVVIHCDFPQKCHLRQNNSTQLQIWKNQENSHSITESK